MHTDFNLLENESAIPTHGGARPGSGPRPNGFPKSIESKNFDRARARNEAAKAGLNEIELKKATGEYLSRTAFREASATLLAQLAHGLRSLPDTLERKHALEPHVVQSIESTIDQALGQIAAGLELFTGAD